MKLNLHYYGIGTTRKNNNLTIALALALARGIVVFASA